MKNYIVLLILVLPMYLYGQLNLDILREESGLTYSEITAKIEKELSTRVGKQARTDEKHFRRWQHAVEPHLDSDGRIVNYAMKNMLAARRNKLMQDANLLRGSTHGNWEDVTPVQFSVNHPNNGRINVIAVHPADPNTVFVGAAVGGLWKTSDAGTTWTSLTDGLPVIGISGIAIDPDNPDLMYILTGDGDARHIPSIGILKSYDGGYTWHETGYSPGPSSLLYGYKLIMDPNDAAKMFVVSPSGILRTTDGWNTWKWVLVGTSCRDIEFRPGSSDTIYVSTTTSVYQSVVGGGMGTWTNLGPLNIGLPDTANMTRVALAVTPTAPDNVYALYAYDRSLDSNGYVGLYISQDNGQSWNQNTDTANLVGAGNYSQSWYNLVLTVDPQVAANVFLGGVQLFQSESMGIADSWNNITDGLHSDMHDIVYSGSTIYVACDGGMGKSLDGGQTWINISDGLSISQFYDIDVLGNKLIGGTQDNGTSLWDLGDIEAARVIGSDGFESILDPSDANVIYGCTQDARLKSGNGGGSFTNIHPPGHGSPWAASWVMHPTDFDTLYSGFKKLARTYDAGISWDTLAVPGFTTRGTIQAIAQGIDDPNVMYVSNRRQLFRTGNIHAAIPVWTDLTPFLPFSVGDTIPSSLSLGGVAVDPEDVNKVWVTCRNYSNGNKVFFHENGGADSSWVNISGTLPNVPVYTVVTQPGTGDGVYIATDLGVFFRRSFFTDWIYFSNGMPNTRVEDLKISDGYLYAGTFGRGLWRSPLYFTCPFSLHISDANDPSSPYSTGTQIYHASSLIQSWRIITGGIGSDVSYTAGQEVVLSPGFHAKSYSLFEAKIGACSN